MLLCSFAFSTEKGEGAKSAGKGTSGCEGIAAGSEEEKAEERVGEEEEVEERRQGR